MLCHGNVCSSAVGAPARGHSTDRKEVMRVSQLTIGSRAVSENGRRIRDDLGYEILLADSDTLTLAAVRDAVERGGFRVVAEARSATEAVEAAVRHRPQICLLGVDLPGDGIAATQEIYSMLPDTRIAMLANWVAEDKVLHAIHAGADGYLLKSTVEGRLASALRAVARGETALPRAVTTRLVQDLRQANAAQAERKKRRIRCAVLYVPRFARHFYRRLRGRHSVSAAWASTRMRMRDYR
jgi:DNA-binding NarL/FixJ family response regulator